MSVNAEFKAAYEHVFLNQCWGNKQNSGKDYKRAYKKTKAKERKAAPVVAATVQKGNKK